LARQNKAICDEQEKEVRQVAGDFRMVSRRASTAFNPEQGSRLPDLLTFGLHNRFHGAIMDLFTPSSSVLMPPWKEGQVAPHVVTVEPFTQCSFRISDEFLREYIGPVPDILTLVSLLLRVGNIGSQPLCKIVAWQRCDGRTAFVRNTPKGKYM
jgi:hypothetical protein